MKNNRDEEYYDYDYEEEEEPKSRKNKKGWFKDFQNIITGNAQPQEYDEEYDYEEREEKFETVSIWTDVITYESVKQIVLNLKHKQQQIINFENTDDESAQYFRQFLYGAVFALDAHIDSISEKSIIITPNNIEIEKPDSKKKILNTSPFRVNF